MYFKWANELNILVSFMPAVNQIPFHISVNCENMVKREERSNEQIKDNK